MRFLLATRRRPIAAAIAATALSLSLASHVDASTFIRSGLEELATTNERIVLARVVDAHSYWNDEKTFILTDYLLATDETIKGAADREVSITLMGGTVDGTTSLIVGGAELAPGRSYLLFLSPADLPGAPRSLSVRDHCQGAFEIRADKGVLRAVSQAQKHALLPDRDGLSQPPGAAEGIALDTLIQQLQTLVRGAAAPELKK